MAVTSTRRLAPIRSVAWRSQPIRATRRCTGAGRIACAHEPAWTSSRRTRRSRPLRREVRADARDLAWGGGPCHQLVLDHHICALCRIRSPVSHARNVHVVAGTPARIYLDQLGELLPGPGGELWVWLVSGVDLGTALQRFLSHDVRPRSNALGQARCPEKCAEVRYARIGRIHWI